MTTDLDINSFSLFTPILSVDLKERERDRETERDGERDRQTDRQGLKNEISRKAALEFLLETKALEVDLLIGIMESNE